jgi:hypothetical protein
MRGATAEAIYAIGGDSGSPAYRLTNSTTAIGIGLAVRGVGGWSTGKIYMTKLKDALDVWPSFAIYTTD